MAQLLVLALNFELPKTTEEAQSPRQERAKSKAISPPVGPSCLSCTYMFGPPLSPSLDLDLDLHAPSAWHDPALSCLTRTALGPGNESCPAGCALMNKYDPSPRSPCPSVGSPSLPPVLQVDPLPGAPVDGNSVSPIQWQSFSSRYKAKPRALPSVCVTLPRLGPPQKPAVASLRTCVISGACFAGIVLNLSFAPSYYALIKAAFSAHSVHFEPQPIAHAVGKSPGWRLSICEATTSRPSEHHSLSIGMN